MVRHQRLVNGVVLLVFWFQAKVCQRIRQEAAVLADNRHGPSLDVLRGRYGKAARVMLRGHRGWRGRGMCLGPSASDGPADCRQIDSGKGLKVCRPCLAGREEGAGLLENDPVVDTAASGDRGQPMEGVTEMRKKVGRLMSHIISRRGKLRRVHAKDTKILASADGALHLMNSGGSNHDVAGERKSPKAAV